MFHFISTPLEVPHNPNWILARCCGEYCRVLTRRGHNKPAQAGSNDAEDELMVAIFLPRFPAVPQRPVPLREQPLHPRPVAVRRVQGDTTTLQHGQHILIQCQNIYIISRYRTALTARTSPTARRSPALTTSSTVRRCVISVITAGTRGQWSYWPRDTCRATLSIATRALLRNPAPSHNVGTRYQLKAP